MNDSVEITVGRYSDKINIHIDLYNYIKSKLHRDFSWLSEIAFNNFYTKFVSIDFKNVKSNG